MPQILANTLSSIVGTEDNEDWPLGLSDMSPMDDSESAGRPAKWRRRVLVGSERCNSQQPANDLSTSRRVIVVAESQRGREDVASVAMHGVSLAPPPPPSISRLVKRL